MSEKIAWAAASAFGIFMLAWQVWLTIESPPETRPFEVPMPTRSAR